MNIFRFGFEAMASACEILIAGDSRKTSEITAERAIVEISRIEKKYSRYLPDSIISKINAAAGIESVECDEETLTLMRFADAFFKSSGGLFDITSGVLRRAWNFRDGAIPERKSLESLLQLVGWECVVRVEKSVYLPHASMEIDFGGFGKEYAADRAAEILQKQGVRYGYVNLGGDIRVVGPKPDGSPWVIGIQDPRINKQTIASIPLYSGALATSGDYERFFEKDGERYCHILSPLTGTPVNGWRSVTVLAATTLLAGSRSTIAMLKENDGYSYLEGTGMKYLAVDRNGQIHHRN
ncbi:MAG: FAD:protein FMN transferase [Chlorobiaceae bacterium]|nr:FAD:protein FMN transferase [Chlorobiaceae bacterium]NTV60268.1 FAD:protein FMN transferase [Chlorobiaceae bacterium]